MPATRYRRATLLERTDARQRLGLPLDAPVLLCIGALAPEKGVDLAIQVCSRLPDTHLVVCGDGPARHDLERLASEVAGGRVHFIGPIGDVGYAYASADVVLMLSRGGDSMPAVLIEAGLCELPAVSTPIAAISQVIDDGVTGHIVPLEDVERAVSAVSGALRDGATLGREARRHCAQSFSIEAVAPSWESLLRAVSDQAR